MKKIGIVTLWNSEDNYGQILQCYALQKFLKQLGHDTFLIRSEVGIKKELVVRRIKKYLYLLLNFHFCAMWNIMRSIFLQIITEQRNRKHPRYFGDFRNRYITSTGKKYTISDLKENPPFADVYICGSDQIWSVIVSSTQELIPFYFLDWGGNCKRISYAASFGGLNVSEIPENTIKEITSYLKRFDAISVREPRGIDICRKAGREDVICVIDPTLLLSQTDYLEISKPFELPNRKYLFIYFIWEKASAEMKSIYKFAHENSLDVIYVASQRNVNRMHKEYPTIEQWLFLVKNAEYVVTDSFHGTVFSIKMNKKFYTLPVTKEFERQNERVQNLLEKYGLKNRHGNFASFILKKEIDYKSINEIMHKDRNEIETWITKCL